MRYGLGERKFKFQIPYRDPHLHDFTADFSIEIDMTTLRIDEVNGEVIEFDWDVTEEVIMVDRYDDAFQFVIQPLVTQDAIHDLYRSKFMDDVYDYVIDEYGDILVAIEEYIGS